MRFQFRSSQIEREQFEENKLPDELKTSNIIIMSDD